MSTSISKSTARSFSEVLAGLTPKPAGEVKAAPARHRVTEHTLPQHRASWLIKSVSSTQRRSR